MTPEELQEICALYVLGALEPQEAAALEARLQAGEPDVVRTITELRDVVQVLPHALAARPHRGAAAHREGRQPPHRVQLAHPHGEVS